jgi:hypothetical protein
LVSRRNVDWCITQTTTFQSSKALWDWPVWGNPLGEMVLGSLHLTHNERGVIQQVLAVAEAVHERSGWPLHVIEHCAEIFLLSSPRRSCVRCARHSTRKHTVTARNHIMSTTTHPVRDATCDQAIAAVDNPFDSRRQPGSRGLKSALGAVLVATVLLFGAPPARSDAVTDWNAIKEQTVVQAALQDATSSIGRRDAPHTTSDHDGSGAFADATIVVRWSQLAQDNAFAVDPAMTDPFPNARGWTMMYLAMHDALNAIVPTFQQYAFFGTDTSAHPSAAAAQAARDVMNHIYPTRQAENDAKLAFWLDQVPDGSHKTNGINLGMASATTIINARANDNMLVFGEYALQNPLAPGDYRFVPPLEFVYRPAFGDAMPFGIGSGADFLPDPPPALTSWAYAWAVDETTACGQLHRTFRSQDQPHVGAWWREFNAS